ncbi:GTP diphosphokinase [Pleionea litopenaei]|uniref:GTP pyrophosphokinase n=1 Tax=Pleionea litopenaei TaxID=3070815 RepID=A0AA51RW43_9GAMM|nr:GTP diphosphokinase [Pleionea sp. HL-JVS1]WMS88544.1 GTP diphosphokinase [Pleionea sp. HL-JVS1]
MVKVADTHFVDVDVDADPQQWLASIPLEYSDRQQKVIADSFLLAKEVLHQHPDKKSLFEQGLAIADILIHLHVDSVTLATAIIYPLYQHQLVSDEKLTEKLSSEITKLCKGALGMDAIQALQSKSRVANPDNQQTDNFRKMLLAMVDDVRLVLVKLAERLTVLRAAKDADKEERLQIALEINDIYAPLANRLGVGQLKWEMEDLAFRYIEPTHYKSIAKQLDERRVDREKYVNRVLSAIQSELEKLGIKSAEVMGRAKHIYSIWRKMKRKNVGFEEIYDVRAVRILVDEIPQCYAALGIVHGLWKHIPKEFDDYIATPKENGYRSLHTAVIGPEGKNLEVQIRTKDMHQESELGVAAHWRYKEGAKAQQAGFEAKISWLRQLLEWQEEVADASEMIDDFRNTVIEDRIYVFTPQGKVIDLPMGATPVDFAYHVHTDVGHNCRGAKISGKIVPLTYKLKTGQQVEVLTTKNGHPSRDWLNPHNGYIRSSRARSKIHQWFRHQDKDKNAAAGRTILDKDLQRHGFEKTDLVALAQKFNFHSEEDLYAAIGAGDIGMTQVINSIRSQLGETIQKQKSVFKAPTSKRKSSIDGIQIEGVGSLLTRIAGCCRPVPGDAIRGYITQGRGVVVHRQDCNYILKASESTPERLITVSWGTAEKETYSADIQLIAFDRKGLLKDITTVFANAKVSIESMNTSTDKKSQAVNIVLRVNVENTDKLSKVLAQLSQVSNVTEVKRKH